MKRKRGIRSVHDKTTKEDLMEFFKNNYIHLPRLPKIPWSSDITTKPGDVFKFPKRRNNMDLTDQYLTTGLILILIAIVGICFPKFTDFLFWLTGIAGILSICWWTWKETR